MISEQRVTSGPGPSAPARPDGAPGARLPLPARLEQRLAPGGLDALRRSAGQGEAGARAELGARLLIGLGAPLDQEQGAELLTAAADEGDPDALAVVAVFAGAGVFMPQDWAASLDRLGEAAARGSNAARSQLTILSGEAGDGPDAWRALARHVDVQAWIRPPERRAIFETPRIRAAEGFTTAAACDWLRERARGRMRPAMMYDGETKTEQLDPHRTCSDYQFDILNTDVVLLLVRERISALVKLPTVAMEPPRIFHYALGEEIKPHYDRCGDAVGGYGRDGGYLGDRIVTFLLYLNDDFEGGELHFPKTGFMCKGRKGDAVYFAHVDPAGKPDPLSLHAGLKVTRGEKWVLSQWIHDRPFGVVQPGPAA